MAHAITHLTRYGFDAFDPAKNVKIRLIEAAPRLLPQIEESVFRMARECLEDLGIEVRIDCKVAGVAKDGAVNVGEGEVLVSNMTAWVAGIGAPTGTDALDGLAVLPNGFLDVRETLQLRNDGAVFALGDCAAFRDETTGRHLPPKAQVASQQAADLARELARSITTGAAIQPFRYVERGSLVNIGAHSTIGQMMGNLFGTKTIDGWLARRAYKYLYRRHQFIVHGKVRGGLLVLSEILRDRVHPRLKLY